MGEWALCFAQLGLPASRIVNEVEPSCSNRYTVLAMTDDKPRETQQELFQEFSTTPKRTERFPTLTKTQKPILISTTLEQILMISIVLILVLCGVFFLGVLRGKSFKQAAKQTMAPAVTIRPAVPKVLAPLAQKPAASTTSTAAPASLPEKPYTIQIVTHRKKEYAETEINAVRKLGFAGFMIPSGEYFQVCAGQYASKEEAKKDLAFFQSKYKDSFLRRHA